MTCIITHSKDRSQQGKVRSQPLKDRSQHFSHDHAKTDYNHATTDHIHTLTTTRKLPTTTISQITAMRTQAGSARHHLFCHPPASHERWKHALHLSEHVASQLLVSQQLRLQWQLERKKSLVTKSSAVQRISSGQILTEILNLWSALKLTTTIQCFHWALCLMMIYHGTKFGCKRTISSEDIQKVIF